MTSALSRYSWRQLTVHRARTALTIATLAAAVVGVWLFAAPRAFDAAMDDQVVADRLHDAILRPDGVALDEADLAALRDIPNVAGLEVRATHVTEVRVGDQTRDVWLVGVNDFDDQQVNVLDIDTGRAPGTGTSNLEALADPVNARLGRGAGAVGETVQIRSTGSRFEPVAITGEAKTVFFSHNAAEWIPVLYVPVEVVWELAPYDGVFTQVEVRVVDRDDAALATTIDAIREQLAEVKPSVRYNALVEIRPEGEWPGEDDFENFLVLFWVIAGVSLVSALVLVATTMTTLVREQTTQIGIMKSIGGRRRRIVATFLTTSALLGLGGTLLGTAIGFPAANLLTGYLSRFQGVEVGWSVSRFAVVLSVAVGLGGTLVASMPSLLRGTRISVRDALDHRTVDRSFGDAPVDRLLARARGLPRTTQLGLRAVARRKGRSIATQLQIALAVGTMLGFTSLVITIIEVSEQSRSAEGGDIELYNSGSGRGLDPEAADLIAGIDGVDRVQPTVSLDLLVGDTDTFAWGLPADPIYAYELDDGRWFDAAENDDAASVAVVGPALATIHDVEVGDEIRAETLDGPATFEVVGIDSTMVGDGKAVFVPIETARWLTGRRHPSWYWVGTTSRETGDIDQVAYEIRSALDERGYGYQSDLRYLERAAQRDEDRTIMAIILSLGIPIVAMGMIGLVSAMTTNILERTREIGILRSLGARARDIRRVFLAEAVALVVLGWLTGTLVGYLIGRIILRAMSDAFDVSFVLRYPTWPIGVALLVTLAVAIVVVRAPLHRAGRLAPSAALRYE